MVAINRNEPPRNKPWLDLPEDSEWRINYTGRAIGMALALVFGECEGITKAEMITALEKSKKVVAKMETVA